MGLVETYKAQVEAFTEECLRPYLFELKATSKAPAPKELNDAVWQTVVLQPFEVLILDSPLLQRLRYVRQLGVAHWTYPGAGHTRFEHSIGAVHQISRLMESLSQRGAELSRLAAVPPKPFINLLRLTALCHDIGHGAMSHVVENAFKRQGTIDDLALELAEHLDIEAAKLSEAAAYFMLGSPAFEELLEKARETTRHDLPSTPETVDLMRKAILGRPIHNTYPLLHELINGPFDADKLDYITRDAHMAGVPIVTDIPRLVQKVRALEVDLAHLPPAVAKRVQGNDLTYVLYGLALSGGRTLDELMFGRTLLFDKIYRHQKVRAVEAMVGSIIELVARVAGDRAALLPLLFEDDDLLDLTAEGLELRLGRRPSNPEMTQLEPARDLASRLKRRRLFVRAFAFAQSMPLDPFRHDDEQRRGFEQLLRDARKPEQGRELVAEIVDELHRMGALDSTAWPQELSSVLQSYVVLDPPDSSGNPKEISRAYLFTDDGQVVHFRDDSAESPAWSAAYLMTRDIGYIFCPADLAPAVFLAAEVVFRKRFGIRTPKSAHDYAKVPAKALAELRRKLTQKGFYDSHPNDLCAEPAFLGRGDVSKDINEIVTRLGSYQGLDPSIGQEHARVVRVDADRIRTWLRQFRDEKIAETALGWLRGLRLIKREDVHAAVRAFMSANEGFKSAWICPFGSPKDSSAIVTYYANDLAPEFGLHAASLSEALAGDDQPILFVDDFIGSGKQARTIICNWFGDAEAPLKEDHGPPMQPHMQAALKARRVGFVFAAGEAEGLQALLEDATRLGLTATGHVHIPASTLPTAFASAAPNSSRDRVAEMGKQLLRSSRPEKGEAWAEEKALGYGGNGYLLAFPYNTPTQTLPLLWSAGDVDGQKWLPLLPRRAKK
jgi:hypothetical protein